MIFIYKNGDDVRFSTRQTLGYLEANCETDRQTDRQTDRYRDTPTNTNTSGLLLVFITNNRAEEISIYLRPASLSRLQTEVYKNYTATSSVSACFCRCLFPVCSDLAARWMNGKDERQGRSYTLVKVERGGVDDSAHDYSSSFTTTTTSI